MCVSHLLILSSRFDNLDVTKVIPSWSGTIDWRYLDITSGFRKALKSVQVKMKILLGTLTFKFLYKGKYII